MKVARRELRQAQARRGSRRWCRSPRDGHREARALVGVDVVEALWDPHSRPSKSPSSWPSLGRTLGGLSSCRKSVAAGLAMETLVFIHLCRQLQNSQSPSPLRGSPGAG